MNHRFVQYKNATIKSIFYKIFVIEHKIKAIIKVSTSASQASLSANNIFFNYLLIFVNYHSIFIVIAFIGRRKCSITLTL